MAFKGIETKRFNNIISQKISENNNDIDLELDTINFKIDIKNFSLFLETKNPNIFYKNNVEPYFLDWQYIHLNKGISDIVFLLVESTNFDPIINDVTQNHSTLLHFC